MLCWNFGEDALTENMGRMLKNKMEENVE